MEIYLFSLSSCTYYKYAKGISVFIKKHVQYIMRRFLRRNVFVDLKNEIDINFNDLEILTINYVDWSQWCFLHYKEKNQIIRTINLDLL